MKKAVTIKDIAEQLNLSRNTVAKALNGRYVSEKNRAQIFQKAAELGYKTLNLAALNKSEMSARKRILLFAGKPLNNMEFFVPFIRGVENYCYANSHELFQYIYNPSTTTFRMIEDYITSMHCDGIIAIECFDKEFNGKLIALGLPICFVDFSTKINFVGNYDIIGPQNFRPIYDMVRKTYRRHGTTKFCFIGDPTHCLGFQERYFGMLQALFAEGISHSHKDDILRFDNFHYGDPNAVKTEILKLRNMPACFVCSNDFIARSVCKALQMLNIAIPDQCFVIGHGNATEATSSTPQITTFEINKEQFGEEVIITLLHRIENPHTPTKKITISTTPVYRESTLRYPPTAHHAIAKPPAGDTRKPS